MYLIHRVMDIMDEQQESAIILKMVNLNFRIMKHILMEKDITNMLTKKVLAYTVQT